MLERDYQTKLVRKLRRRFPGCVILKNDTGYLQGIPDLTIFYGERWGVLEVKISEHAPIQLNQDWYIDELNKMSFAAFIYPENEEDVLNELQRALEPRRDSRLS